jgi:hypothetical protein
VDEKIADDYLCKKLSLENRIKYTKYDRLMLHAINLEFVYNGVKYNIFSKQRFLKEDDE